MKLSRRRPVKLIAALLVLSVVTVGCVVGYLMYRGSRASPEDCQKACTKFAELQKAESGKDGLASNVGPLQKVTDEFQVKLMELQKAMGEDIAAIQTDCDTRAMYLKTDWQKKRSVEYCSQRKNDKAQEWAPKFVEMNQMKKDVIKVATEAQVKFDEDKREAAEKQSMDCVDECVKDGTSQTLVDCRLRATSVFYFNACE